MLRSFKRGDGEIDMPFAIRFQKRRERGGRIDRRVVHRLPGERMGLMVRVARTNLFHEQTSFRFLLEEGTIWISTGIEFSRSRTIIRRHQLQARRSAIGLVSRRLVRKINRVWLAGERRPTGETSWKHILHCRSQTFEV
jgi:hypothetical protein